MIYTGKLSSALSQFLAFWLILAGVKPVLALTASQAHGGTITSGGQVCMVGQNEIGELGDGTYVNRESPVLSALSGTFTSVATGWSHTLAVKADGTVWSWGDNSYGELGNGTEVSHPTPAQVPGLANVVAVAAGNLYSLALKSDGTVWGWGYNLYGEVGDGIAGGARLSPVQVAILPRVIAIAAGADHAMALKSDGTVWTWGHDANGDLGTGPTGATTATPVQVQNLSGTVTAIAAGSYHSLALKSDGTVWGWGYDYDGELGDGSSSNESLPVQASGLTGVTAIGAGFYHSLAVSGGTVWAWGSNASGQIGDNTTTNRHVPTPATGGLTNVVSVAGGASYSLALTNADTISAWGDNTYGQLGTGNVGRSLFPIAQLPCPAPNNSTVSAGSLSGRLSASQNHSLAIKSDGSILAWGQNESGELGDATYVNRDAPVSASVSGPFVSVATGWSHTLAVKADGTVWSWGNNDYGELGNGNETSNPTPTQVPGLTKVIGVAAGNLYSLALKSDGTVWGWGYNLYGEVGDGTTSTRINPVQVATPAGIIAIAAGADHSMALKSDGTVWTWGHDANGDLGTGPMGATSATPVQVQNLNGVVIAIAAGWGHSLALKSDGTVWGWGNDADGELGDGATNAESNPVRVSDLTGVTAIGAGFYHSLAVKSDGTVWAWGYNADGELGNGTTTGSNVPVQTNSLGLTYPALAVVGGASHSLALTKDGSVWAWGLNTYGQLGTGNLGSSLSPAQSLAQVGAIYSLTLLVSPASSGTISVTPSSSDGNYPTGTRVCLSATPAAGYIFSGWSGATLDAAGCLTVSGSDSVTANFTLLPMTTALQYVPVVPCRIADTRNANGPFGGPPISGDGVRSFTIPASACGIPATAEAYSINATVVPSGTLGYITVFPTGQPRPLASTLNSLDGRIKANAAIVPAGTGGAVSVFASDQTNVILDINGYFVPASTPSSLAFYPLTPCRVADTRQAAGALGGPSLAANQSRTFPVLTSSCNIPSEAQAYSLNFTVVPHGALGYLTVWPTGESRPTVSTLNALTGAITANAAIVPAGSSGSVDVFASGATDVVVDINGYFAPPAAGGLSLYTLSPCRILDDREPSGSVPLTGTVAVNATGVACGVPISAQAVVLNATVVPQGSLGYITLWPAGQAQPGVSTLNALDGAITSNMAIVPTTNGTVDAFASNPTYLILDAFGYYAPPPQ